MSDGPAPAAEGTALAAVVLQTQILHALIRSGTLSKRDALTMLDAAILGVEQMPRDQGFSSAAIAFARERLMSVQRMVEVTRPPNGR